MNNFTQQPPPLVSVIVPIFNVADYLESALDSLLQQSLQHIEIIAIDDYSTDNSKEILQQKAAIDSRLIAHYSTVNRGLSRTRNFGMAQAKGKWIAFLDSDDYLKHEALQTWYQQAEENQVDLLLGNGFRFEHDPAQAWDKGIRPEQEWAGIKSGSQWIIDAVMSKQWNHFTWLNFIRRDFLLETGVKFREDLLHEDILMTTDLALAAKRVTFCSVPFYGYRQRQDSIVHSVSEQTRIDRARSYLLIIQALVEAGKEQQDKRLRRALTTQAMHEVGVVMGIMRKKIADQKQLRELASLFISFNLTTSLMQGCRNLHEIFRLLKFHRLCTRLSRITMTL
ncbi:MAG: glycosyltransferase [Enterobacteriaceae bacterium]